MPDYGSWEELCEAAQGRCKDILNRDVAPVAKDIVKKHIQKDIYDAYALIPNGWIGGQTYQRRHVLENSIYHKFTSNDGDEIIITSNGRPSDPVVKHSVFDSSVPGAFFLMLEVGDMGFWRKGFPRPAIGNAQKKIDHSPDIRAAIQSGLDRYF